MGPSHGWSLYINWHQTISKWLKTQEQPFLSEQKTKCFCGKTHLAQIRRQRSVCYGILLTSFCPGCQVLFIDFLHCTLHVSLEDFERAYNHWKSIHRTIKSLYKILDKTKNSKGFFFVSEHGCWPFRYVAAHGQKVSTFLFGSLAETKLCPQTAMCISSVTAWHQHARKAAVAAERLD